MQIKTMKNEKFVSKLKKKQLNFYLSKRTSISGFLKISFMYFSNVSKSIDSDLITWNQKY